MGQDKIKELFFENPSTEFYLRQVSRITNVPKTTAARVLNELVKEKIAVYRKGEPFGRYIANSTGRMYRFYKKSAIVEKILKSGLVDCIAKEALPKSIILFGSCAKGEHNKSSDIDIFSESAEIRLKLEDFRLGHKINVFFAESLLNVSSELRNNIINGEILYGAIRFKAADELQRVQGTSPKGKRT